jgi:hypothetical protein
MIIEDWYDSFWPEDEYVDIVCKFCGKRGFHWIETTNGWRLATMTGRIHSCKKFKIDGF